MSDPASPSLPPPPLTLSEGEHHLRELFEAASDLILVVNPEGQILLANRRWRETLGFREPDLAGLNVFDVTHRADHAACQSWLQHPPPRDTAGHVRLRFLTRDGQEVPVEGATSARIEGGQVVFLHGVFHDVTQQRHESALLREQAQLLKALTTHASIGVFRTDREGRLSYTNDRWRRFAGLTHVDEPRGVWWQMVHPDDRPAVIAHWQRATSQKREFVAEFRSRETGTTVRWYRTRLAPSQGAPGEPESWVGLSEDITVTWKASQQLRHAKAELEAAVTARTAELRATNRDLSEFAYALTHDMKAPLRGIHRLAEWLVKDHADQLGQEGSQLCGLLQERVRFLNDFIEGMLTYSRVGREQTVDVDVPLGPIVNRVRELLATAAVIEWSLPGSLPVVRGVPEYLHRVFLNLLDNAVKYLDKPEGRIELRCHAVADGWEFSVSDNGPGIPERYHEKLFQMFQKLPPAAGSAGAGIGLAVVRRIVESRGGRVGLQTKEGHGTTITVFWPDYPKAVHGNEPRTDESSPENGRAAPSP